MMDHSPFSYLPSGPSGRRMPLDHTSARYGLLINGVFSNAVGHIIEALMIAQAFRNSNSAMNIGLLINSDGPTSLSQSVPHLDIEIFGVAVSRFLQEPAGDLWEGFPHNWEYEFTIRDHTSISNERSPVKAFGKSYCEWAAYNGIRSRVVARKKFPRLRPSQLILQIPSSYNQEAMNFVSHAASPRIMILPGSATHQKAPTIQFWAQYIGAIQSRYPNCEIILIGVHGAHMGATVGISQTDIALLLHRFPRCKSAFNLGILQQLAIASRCNLFVSPHSGMGFAVQCIGVPWLVISGWKNHEYLTNGIPYTPIFPQCPFYPCTDSTILDACRSIIHAKQGTLPCMDDEALTPKLPEMVMATVRLVDELPSYRRCVKEHREKLRHTPGRHRRIMENIAPSWQHRCTKWCLALIRRLWGTT